MARRGKEKKKEEFNSFIDIMTCLAGILILIILLVIVQIQEVRVLIPTPMERVSDKAPIFIEARNNMLYTINIDRIKERIETAIAELTERSTDPDGRLNQREFLRQLGMTQVEDEGHIVDLSFSLIGQYALRPNPEILGYQLPEIAKERDTDWFGSIIRAIDRDREMITFIVRDDSFDVFRNARALAWIADVEVSWHLVPYNEPIKFGLSGETPFAQ